jgi:acetate kinase
MKILVANLGSTSLKYRLFEMEGERETLLARGGFERVTDYGEAIDGAMNALRKEGCLERPEEIAAVGFKTVLGKGLSGCVVADERVMDALESFREVAPAHNPPYAAGIRMFREKLPAAVPVALFETAFYQWVPEPAQRYALPKAWENLGIRRYGFHGASHKFVAERTAELLGRKDVAAAARMLYRNGPQKIAEPPFRVVSCHLGGSSSVTGIRNGVAIGTSMGFSPQSGLPQNNRVGDLDAMAIPYAMHKLGLTIEDAERQLSREAGMFGLSGVSNDLRDIRLAARAGDERARLALDVLIHSCRHWIGAFFFELQGADAIAFTAGIGENDIDLRAGVCANLEGLGIRLDPSRNGALRGQEGLISAPDSRVKVLVVPANEERVVARETYRLMIHRDAPAFVESAAN